MLVCQECCMQVGQFVILCKFCKLRFARFWRENVVRSKSLSILRWSFYKLVRSMFNKLRNISCKLSRFLLSTFIFYSQYIFAPEISEMVWSLQYDKNSFHLDQKRNTTTGDFFCTKCRIKHTFSSCLVY